jgi:hypothetical protein
MHEGNYGQSMDESGYLASISVKGSAIDRTLYIVQHVVLLSSDGACFINK